MSNINPRFLFALWASKTARAGLRLLGKNATYLPGDIAIRICPDFIGRMEKPEKVICVTGTNGKTTSCNLLIGALEKLGYEVLNNKFGSNVNAGVASSLLADSTLTGKARKKVAVFEVDERSSLRIYPFMKPDYLLCTNLFRDSIHRNAHAEYISGIISKYTPAETKLILNADDLISSGIAKDNDRVYFGIERMASDRDECVNIINDMRICPVCSTTLEYEYVRYHHIGKAHCPSCGFKSPVPDYSARADLEGGKLALTHGGETIDVPLISDSIFNAYNELSVITLLSEAFTDMKTAAQVVSEQKIVETRYSGDRVGGKEVITNMAKGMNSVACSIVFDYVRNSSGSKEIILVLDDVFDNNNSSEYMCWVYDVDFEFLNDPQIKRIIVGGVRCLDYKVRMLLAGIPEEKIICVDKETDTPDYLGWDTDKIYILHELYRNDEALGIRDEIKRRLASGEAKK